MAFLKKILKKKKDGKAGGKFTNVPRRENPHNVSVAQDTIAERKRQQEAVLRQIR